MRRKNFSRASARKRWHNMPIKTGSKELICMEGRILWFRYRKPLGSESDIPSTRIGIDVSDLDRGRAPIARLNDFSPKARKTIKAMRAVLIETNMLRSDEVTKGN